MKPTQQEIIDVARDAGIVFDERAMPYYERLVHLALERFGAGGGEPTGYLVGHSGEYHYFRHKADAEREKAEQERCSGESCGDVEPVFRRPSPTALRAEYLRGLEDAKKVCVASELIDLPTIKEIAAIRKCAQAIEALKDKQ